MAVYVFTVVCTCRWFLWGDSLFSYICLVTYSSVVEEEVTNTEEKSSSEVKRGKSSKAMLLGIVRRGTKSKTG
jgi:hypothetical protein